jgi:4-amino-4-deoxy-L-arabinose transferase-like glycosyltransferase
MCPKEMMKDQARILISSSDRLNGLGKRLSFYPNIHLFIITVLFLMTRCLFLLTPAGRFGDADQAVFGMMAQKIASLEEYPIYCWEAHYAGAPVAYIAAMIFHFFGAGFVQLRIAMLLIIFPGFILFYFLYRRLFDSQRAFIAVLFFIFCPFIVLDCTTAAYGGYGESFLGMTLIILLSWKIRDQSMSIPTGASCFLLGLTCGFFTYIQFFVIPAVLAFAIPTLWTLGENRIKSFWRFSLGGLVGIFPMIIYNFITGGGTLTRGAAWILLIGRDDISVVPLEVVKNIVLQKSTYLCGWLSKAPLMFGQYIIPGILGHELQIFAGFMLIIIFASYIASSFKKVKRNEAIGFYHRQFAFYLVIFVLFQWVVSLGDGRHFIPLFFIIPIALFSLSEGYSRLKNKAGVIMLMFSVFQVIGWNQAFSAPRFDSHPVAKSMESRGIREFYASYWTGYPIMFLGEGRLIGSPMLLPSKEPFSDRRPQYTEQVRRSQDAAFVFGSKEEPLEKEFLAFVKICDIKYKTIEIDGTRIYYGMSTPVVASFNKNNRQNFFSLKQQP